MGQRTMGAMVIRGAGAMMKILLVEDSRVLRERIRRMIEEIPKAVLVAETGSEIDARSCLEKYQPDVAVIDLRLSTGSGLALLEHIKAVYPAILKIVLTNYGQPEYRDTCMALGADYFFDKSMNIDAFNELLVSLSRVNASVEQT
jgi:DNA-binding NarL/FixJ family response regulator